MIFTALRLAIEILPAALLGYLWWDERENWMLVPIVLISSMVVLSG